VRYRFRGLIRANGKPVEGHVEAPDTDEAINVLSENGIVTESLREEPKALDLSQEPHKDPDLVKAIESALDISSTQVPFDALAEKFKGKSVWVVDRDKIRRKVAQVVDSALSQAMDNSDTSVEARARVAEAIDGLFKDNRNLTSQVSSTTMQLEQQIARLGSFIVKAEGVLAAMSMAIRSGIVEGHPRRVAVPSAPREGRNEVLLEIFKSNLELRGIEIETPVEDLAAGQTNASGNGSSRADQESSERPARPEQPT
jgi:hypothetical protein